MRLISPLLKRVIYPGLSHSGYLRRRNPASPVVLTYHGVLPPSYQSLDSILDANLVSIPAFRQQLKFLKANYKVISPGEFQAWCEGKHELPDRSVLLTCDDGLCSCLDYMVPALQEEQLSCLFFLTDANLQTDFTVLWHELLFLSFIRASIPFQIRIANPFFAVSVGARSQLDKGYWQTLLHLSRISENDRQSALLAIWTQLEFHEHAIVDSAGNRERFGVMNATDVLALSNAGMEIGGHTTSHLVLANMEERLARREIQQNRAALQQLTGQSIFSLAYPFGTPASLGPREYQLAREAGYSCAFTNCAGSFDSRFALPRVHITRDMHIAEFEAHVSGFHYALQTAAARQMGAACI